jgi:7-carboxy-7-deazaguanine synthase
VKIAEIYRSVQGEGSLTGIPSIFVRTSGCNLRCWFCDTPFASWQPEGADLSLDDILARVDEFDCPHVVATGGEPMLWSELVPLVDRLRANGRHVTIETAGTLYLPIVCDLISISPKFANSSPRGIEHRRWRRRHEQARYRPEIAARLMREMPWQLKFVIDTPEDLLPVEQYLEELAEHAPVDRACVYLMPQGVDQTELAERGAWLAPYCSEQGYQFCPRKQIEWFGLVRGT